MGTKLSLVGAVGLVLGALAGPGASAAPADDTETEYGRMLLLLDSSGSMKEEAGGGTKIEAAKSALGTVIDDLPDDAHVGLRVFGAEVFSRSDKGACQDTQQGRKIRWRKETEELGLRGRPIKLQDKKFAPLT